MSAPGYEVSTFGLGIPSAGDRAKAVATTVTVMIVTVVAAGLFLPHQAVWVDESTQLSGLTLSPAALLHWLVHPASHDFGVPPDRMPPLSYWLQWVWSRLFGLNERSLRWFGVLCTAGAAGLVSSAGRRAFGARAGLFAGLFVALSPNVCLTAVEIRAYPLFLLATSGALRALVVLLDSPDWPARRRSWLALAAWLVFGMYVHFYGALFAGVVTIGLAIDGLRKQRSLRPVMLLAGVLAIGLGGLVPFAMASVSISSGTIARDRVREVAQLIYRLVAHPAMAVFPAVVAMAFGAAAVLLIAGWRTPSRSSGLLRFLVLTLLAGIAISSAANFVAAGFTAAKVSYATWALPLVSLVLAAPLASSSGRWSRIALIAALIFVACEGAGVAELAWNGEYFVHGPERHLQQVLHDLGPQRVAVIHADPLDGYGFAYFPLRFENGPAFRQFVLSDSGERPPLGVPLDPTTDSWTSPLRDYSSLVVVRSRSESASEIAEQIRHGDHPFGESRLIAALEASGQWRRRQHWLFVSFVAADVTVFERATTAP